MNYKYRVLTLSESKNFFFQKAMAKMDKNSRQEVLDNDWLKREVSDYWQYLRPIALCRYNYLSMP